MSFKKTNFICLILCSFIFSTCSVFSSIFPSLSKSQTPPVEDSQTSFFSSFPSNDGLVFIGVAGRRSNPKETLQLAIENAAQRVAVFYHISGEYAVKSNIGSGAFDYSYMTRTQLFTDKENALQYIDALKYDADTDTIELENSIFIRTVYPSSLPYVVNYRPKYSGKDKKPDWIENPPKEIEGYNVGIGYSGRYSSITDSFTNSWYNAVFEIIREINTSAQNSEILYQNTGNLFGYKTSSDNTLYSFGAIDGFFVLDTWIDPKEKTVWTLAIAKKSN